MDVRRLLWNLQTDLPDQVSRDKCAEILAFRLNQEHKWSLPKAGPRARGASKQLQSCGWIQIPDVLSSKQIQNMHRWLENQSQRDFYDKRNVFTEVPRHVRMSEYSLKQKLACPHFIETMNHPLVTAIASEWLETLPTITYIGLHWSWPRNGEAIHMQKFHRDRVDFKFCKLFVFLTDVDETSGPHVLIEGSNRGELVTHGGRYEDEYIERKFGTDKEKILTGLAGSSFIVDVYSVHRGLPPTKRPRLMLQVEYALIPPIDRTFTPQPHSHTFSKEMAYMNRMLLKR